MLLARGRHEFPSPTVRTRSDLDWLPLAGNAPQSCAVSARTQVLRKPLWLLWTSLAFVLCVGDRKMITPLIRVWLERRLLGKRRETRSNVRNGHEKNQPV